MKKEATFEQELQYEAKRYGCLFQKIPDVIPISKFLPPRALKRPADGILGTPRGNIMVELKYGSNPLKGHQWRFLDEVRQINGLAYVLRKYEKYYTLEQIVPYDAAESILHHGGRKTKQTKKIKKFNNISQLIEFCVDKLCYI